MKDSGTPQATFCDALGNPTRYRIVKALRDHSVRTCCDRLEFFENAVTVADVVALTGLSQATVSQHLAVLLQAGLLRREKRNTWSCYFLNTDRVEAELRALWTELGPPALPVSGGSCDPGCGQ